MIYKSPYQAANAIYPQIVSPLKPAGSWWRNQMEAFSALLALCAGNSPVPGEFLSQRPVTRSFGVFFDLRVNKRLSRQSWGWWFETPSCSLWRHCKGSDLEPDLVTLLIDVSILPGDRLDRQLKSLKVFGWISNGYHINDGHVIISMKSRC